MPATGGSRTDRTVARMRLLDVLRALVDETASATGSIENCRIEVARLAEVERQVAGLSARIPPREEGGSRHLPLSA